MPKLDYKDRAYIDRLLERIADDSQTEEVLFEIFGRIRELEADLTRAHAERDAAREALDKLKKKARAVAYPGFKAIPPSELVSTDRRRIEELKAAVDEARAAIKAAEKGR